MSSQSATTAPFAKTHRILHVCSSRRVVETSAELLEAEGVDSGPRDAFGCGQEL